MVVEIKMPNLSQTTDVVKLLKWLVKVGDKVKKGDAICEVETDKVNVEVESFADGQIIKLFGDQGKEIRNGTVIAILGEKGETREIASKPEKPVHGRDTGSKIKGRDEDTRNTQSLLIESRVTKLVQRLAEKNNIDLAEITGSGPRGTIVKKDLEDYTNRSQKKETTNIEYWELTPNQQVISANLSKSKSSIPHYYLKSEVLIDNLLIKRNASERGKKLSMYAYLIFYSAKALVKFPKLNGYFKDNRVYKNNQINIGFAVASGDELYVPIVKDANKKSLEELNREVKILVSKAQEKKLGPANISGGTFTISNLGIYPVNEFFGVINYPQAALLGIGNIRKILQVKEDNSLAVKKIFNITGSFDHRIANGSQAALFLTEIKKLLEEVK